MKRATKTVFRSTEVAGRTIRSQRVLMSTAWKNSCLIIPGVYGFVSAGRHFSVKSKQTPLQDSRRHQHSVAPWQTDEQRPDTIQSLYVLCYHLYFAWSLPPARKFLPSTYLHCKLFGLNSDSKDALVQLLIQQQRRYLIIHCVSLK